MNQWESDTNDIILWFVIENLKRLKMPKCIYYITLSQDKSKKRKVFFRHTHSRDLSAELVFLFKQ